MATESHGPHGELRSSAAHRTNLESAARDTLATIDRYLRGEIDGLVACRSIVNDEYLREIAPITLLIGFIGVESQFGQDPDEDEASSDPAELAEQRAERDEFLAEEAESLTRGCAALANHLEEWRRDSARASAAPH